MSPSQLSSRPLQISVGTVQPQAWPQALSGHPSSTNPLQLSSRQLQVSSAQCLALVPSRLSGSLGSFDTAHLLDTPSSIWLLQLSSTPLHTSAGGTVLAMMSTSACLTDAVSVSVTKMAWVVPPALAIRLAVVFSAVVRPLSVRMYVL